MSDLIDSLRSPIIGIPNAVSLALEAADEIERLRAERDRWQHTADTQDDLLNQQAQRIADLEGALRDAIVYLKECGKQFASIGDHVMQAGCYNVTERLEDALKEAQ